MVKQILEHIGLYSPSAEELLLLTAATESISGHYFYQLNNGPAKGIFQMEPATEQDCWDNFLSYRTNELYYSRIRDLYIISLGPDNLIYNLAYQIAMARIRYYRVPAPLPTQDDIQGLAQYWKDHYNTYLGAGIPEKAIEAYHKYILGR